MRIDNKLHEFLKSRVRFGGHPTNAVMMTKFRQSDSEIDEALERLEAAGRIVITGAGLGRKFVVHDMPVEYVEPVVSERAIAQKAKGLPQTVIAQLSRKAQKEIATVAEADEAKVPDDCTCDHIFTADQKWHRTYHLGCPSHAMDAAVAVIDDASDAGSYAKAIGEVKAKDSIYPDLGRGRATGSQSSVVMQGKPRVSAKILRASIAAQIPLHEFCTELMNEGLKVWQANHAEVI